MRILVIEDDPTVGQYVKRGLEEHRWAVDLVTDGEEGERRASSEAYDLIILDMRLPGKNGLEVLHSLRARGFERPVLVLTAQDAVDAKVTTLRAGADDYVTKPFDLQELIARVHAVLRRVRPSIPRLSLGRVTVDFSTLRAWKGSSAIELSHREFALLRYLAERQGAVVDREELLHALWEFAESPHTRAVDHAIVRLRRKVEEDPHAPKFIQTVHGGGYTLTLTESSLPVPRR